jgi:predicted nuclease with TOPRIM domain
MKKKHRIKKLERDVAELFRRFTALNGRVMDLECRIDECAPMFPPVGKEEMEALSKAMKDSAVLVGGWRHGKGLPK